MRTPPSRLAARPPLLHRVAAVVFLGFAALAYFAIPSLVLAPAASLLLRAAGRGSRPDDDPAAGWTSAWGKQSGQVAVLNFDQQQAASSRSSRFPALRTPEGLSFEQKAAISTSSKDSAPASDNEEREADDGFDFERSSGIDGGTKSIGHGLAELDAEDGGDELALEAIEIARRPARQNYGGDATEVRGGSTGPRGPGGISTDSASTGEETKKERYLLFIQHSGLSNQLINLRKAAKLAALYNRTLIVPPLQSSHLKQRPVIAESGFSDDGKFVDVIVQTAELAKPENQLELWLEISPAAGSAGRFVSLQEYVKRTRRMRYRCWNVQEPVSLLRVDNFLPWRRAAEEEEVLCIGRPYKISINGKFVADYLRFSSTVAAVGDAWLKRNGLGPGRQDFIGAHIRRGDFVIYYCEKKNFPEETCNPTYDQMFDQVDDIARRAALLPVSAAGAGGPPAEGEEGELKGQGEGRTRRRPPPPAAAAPVPVVLMTNERSKAELARMASRGWLRFSPSGADVRLLIRHGAALGIPEHGLNGEMPRLPTPGELSMLTILVDQYIGTKATYFVGNRHSTFTLVIWQFRDCRRPIACKHWGERRIGESE